jgi:hypothetical protein
VFKAELLLGYLSGPHVRARIRRGLLIVEPWQVPARDVNYVRRGRINAGALHEQTRTARLVSSHPKVRGGGERGPARLLPMCIRGGGERGPARLLPMINVTALRT